MDNNNSDPPPSYEQATCYTHYGVSSRQQIGADQQTLEGLSRPGVSTSQATFQPEGEWNLAISLEQQVGSSPNPDPPPSYEQATYNTQYGVPSSLHIGEDQLSLEGLLRQGVNNPQARLQPQGERNSRIWFCAFSPEQQVGALLKPGTENTQVGFRRQENRDQREIIPQPSQLRPQSQPCCMQPGFVQTTQPATHYQIRAADNTIIQPRQSSPSNYWVQTCFAVVSLCCCFPTGVCALYCACKAKKCAANGNTDNARRKSRCAICLIVISFIFGLAWICFFIVVGA